MVVSLNSVESVKDYITDRAQDYSYPVIKALAIAECESQFRTKIKNPSATSTATGVFQFVDKTWFQTMKQMGLPTTTPKTEPHYNIEAGLFLLDKEGDKHWAASKSCWQPKYMEYLQSVDN